MSPNPEGGQVDQSETWEIIQLFHRYDASHVVSLCPHLFRASRSPYHGDDLEGWWKIASVRVFTVTQNWARKIGSETTRKTTRKEDRRIVRQAHVDPTVTRSTKGVDADVAFVPQTISRHFAEANLKSKCHFRALPLTPEHRQLRLQWCQARSMWSVTDFQKFVFSDGSRFILGTDGNRVWLWRRPAYDRRSTLIVMRGTLTVQRYVDDILRPLVVPFLNGFPGTIFQQDNSRPHTALIAQDFVRHFQTLPWPVRSPDLYPVEHVWDQLKQQRLSCHSIHDLELSVQDLWAHLLQENIRCLIRSMPDRVAACIAAGCGPARY
ncbi:transposable element Tcb2 transposase [Trichonephila clavipes]|nr:transposable element Tcb2 transposase [Trichonephila clavipes]